MFEISLYLSLGAITGFLAGLLGIGGGVISVPGLVYAFSFLAIPQVILMHLAEGSSIAAIALTMIVAVLTHHKNKMIDWIIVKQLAPGIVVGCILGVFIAAFLPTKALKVIFGIFVLVIAVQLLWSHKREKSVSPPPSLLIQKASGIFVGLLSGLLGIGGGVVAVPLLLRFGLPIHQASATSTTCALLASLIGTISFSMAGWYVAGLPSGATGYVYWPAALCVGIAGIVFVRFGTRLAKRLSGTVLKRLFALLLLIIGVDMLVR